MHNIEQERQQFEAWGKCRYLSEEFEFKGTYLNPNVYGDWLVWQAAINSRPESRQTEMKQWQPITNCPIEELVLLGAWIEDDSYGNSMWNWQASGSLGEDGNLYIQFKDDTINDWKQKHHEKPTHWQPLSEKFNE